MKTSKSLMAWRFGATVPEPLTEPYRAPVPHAEVLMANAATTPPQDFNWRMPAGFIFGLGLILASAAFTISAITDLSFSVPVISAIFIGLVAVYFVHAFTVTFWIYIGAIAIAVFWPDTFLQQFLGTLVAGLLDGAPHRDPPGLIPGEALAGGILCCLIVGMFSIRRRDNFQGSLFYSFMGLLALGEILRVFITVGFNSETLGYAAVIAVCGGIPALALYRSSRRNPEHRFSAMWSKTAFFDSAFTRYLVSRAPSILLVVMIYLYVVVSFAAVYFYIDNCNHQERLCSVIDYKGFLDSQVDSKEQCWSFHSVPPLAYGKKTEPDKALCEDHKTSEHFTVDTFLPYLYFSVVTSTTVGYGDVSPLSVSAAWIVIVHHLIAIVLFVAVVAQLANFTMSPASTKT